MRRVGTGAQFALGIRGPAVLDEAGIVAAWELIGGPDEELAEIAILIIDGTDRPVLDSTFPLDDVAAAHDHARSDSANGKISIAAC